MNFRFRYFSTLLVLGAFVSFVHTQEIKPGANLPLKMGDPNAEFKLEIFLDFQCPSCARFNEILKDAKKKYGNRLFIIYRHFPLPLHDKAILSARAVEAAYKQSKGFEMAEILLDNQQKWSVSERAPEIIRRYAKSLDLNIAEFEKDLNAQETLARINLDTERGKSLQLGAVPTVILNGKQLNFIDVMEIEEIFSKSN